MSTPNHLIRAVWTLFEPVHAITYFAPESREAFAAIGLTRYWDGYFAGRAAPLGRVNGDPVAAIFSGFSPAHVTRALPAAWSLVSPEQALEARATGASAALAVLLADIDTTRIERAADALAMVADRVDTAGHPLAAANRALAAQSDALRRLWQAATTLREHRGEGHVIALVSEGIGGISSLLLRTALDLDAETIRVRRGWSEQEWADGRTALIERGLLAPDGTLTTTGHAALDRAEHLTNTLAARPWAHLDGDQVRAIGELLEPIAAACGGLFPYPNPIGMPQPWRPSEDPEATAIPQMPRAR